MNKAEMERIEAAAIRLTFSVLPGGEGGGELMEYGVSLAGDTADIETGQLLVIKRCLCPVAFCNYKCLNIGLFTKSASFFTFICHKSNKFLQADGGLSLHATFSCSVADVICGRVTWLLANLTAVCYKTANFSVINTDSSQLWYSASSCYVLCKCVIIKCVI